MSDTKKPEETPVKSTTEETKVEKKGAERADDRINIAKDKEVFFYVDLAKKLLADKEKPSTLELTGLGSSIATVVSVADILRDQGLATVSKLETGLSGRSDRTAKIQVWITKTPDFETVYAKQVDEKAEKLRQRVEGAQNSAFIFIKPHAVTEEVKELVKTNLEKHEIKITSQRAIRSQVIDKKELIDKHYYAIASKATLLKPSELPVPADKFKEKFGLEWKDALEKGIVFNAADALKKLDIDADALDKEWAKAKKDNRLIKFGGGFYCAKIEIEGKDTIYTFNGFYMTMRAKYTVPGDSLYYYTVEWDPKKLSWADFRAKVLGATDPATAEPESLRGLILKNWESLGLKSEPNVGDNGVHGSASPFEGLAERINWLREGVEKNQFGKLLIASGVPRRAIKEWLNGKIFDDVEDLDAPASIEKIVALSEEWKKEDAARKEAAEAEKAAKAEKEKKTESA